MVFVKMGGGKWEVGGWKLGSWVTEDRRPKTEDSGVLGGRCGVSGVG
ncbi:hypothetical protein [Algoriphagus sp. NG3]|nr:hypothetical protein [Algoriphagus sp. NG3]WPR77530.1 hypothetical protein SLW71_09240 [Algoriphagus sp. NG3]